MLLKTADLFDHSDCNGSPVTNRMSMPRKRQSFYSLWLSPSMPPSHWLKVHYSRSACASIIDPYRTSPIGYE